MRIQSISHQDAIAIRHRVLWPDKPIEHCMIDGDEDANHYGAFLSTTLVGVASTYECDGLVRLRKFAVDGQHQGKGLGTALFEHALNQAVASGASAFWCDSREHAVPFYEKFGLSIEGNRFYKSELPYFKMSLKLVNA